ncbi:MAG: hypothetical protein IE916_00015 [Epsilonproteobacteria bacterium]|nr:hypothetical protein [Campylobacterota bacterium]
MKRFLFMIVPTMFLHGVDITVADVILSYNNEIKKMEELEESVRKARESSEKTLPEMDATIKNQRDKVYQAKNLVSASAKTARQTSNISDVMSHASNALAVKNKQMIYRLMMENSRVSREEIREKFVQDQK